MKLKSLIKKKFVEMDPAANGDGSHRIFIQRDYRQGVAIRFVTDFPPKLGRYIKEERYDFTINKINEFFREAEEFNCATVFESFLGFISANALYLCTDTKYERCLKKVSKFVMEENKKYYMPLGVQIIDPVERGLRCIEINILRESPSSITA